MRRTGRAKSEARSTGRKKLPAMLRIWRRTRRQSTARERTDPPRVLQVSIRGIKKRALARGCLHGAGQSPLKKTEALRARACSPRLRLHSHRTAGHCHAFRGTNLSHCAFHGVHFSTVECDGRKKIRGGCMSAPSGEVPYSTQPKWRQALRMPSSSASVVT